jgi:hypothetical protein
MDPTIHVPRRLHSASLNRFDYHKIPVKDWLVLVQVIAGSLVFVAFHFCAAGTTVSRELRIDLASPQDFQVVQRSTKTRGELIVTGSIRGESENDHGQ